MDEGELSEMKSFLCFQSLVNRFGQINRSVNIAKFFKHKHGDSRLSDNFNPEAPNIYLFRLFKFKIHFKTEFRSWFPDRKRPFAIFDDFFSIVTKVGNHMAPRG